MKHQALFSSKDKSKKKKKSFVCCNLLCMPITKLTDMDPIAKVTTTAIPVFSYR